MADKKEPRRRSRGPRRILPHVSYPHGTHPALVPGVSIDDQRIRYGVDKPIVGIVGALIVAFIVWGVSSPQSVMDVSSAGLTWVMDNMGWIFNGMAIFVMVFLLGLAISRYGKIPLGVDGEPEEYSTGSWVAMLFGAGIGIGMIFFGTLEPLTHYLTPLPGSYEPASSEAVKGAIAQAGVHWGINAWAFYALVGVAVGYASFRKGRVPLMSSVLTPLFPGSTSSSPGARIVDGLAIIATLFGTAASLGIGALQIGRGVEIVTGWSAEGNAMAIMIISVLTAGTIASAVSGVAKGIRILSNVNMYLSIFLGLFFFVAGPTVFLINLVPGVVMEYTQQLHNTLSATMSDDEATRTFLSGWSTFYWAWWVSWAPFVGLFTAKISRGRTIRQLILGTMFIPSSIILLIFTLLGGTAIWLQRQDESLAPGNDPANMGSQEGVFFEVVDKLPGAGIISVIVLGMLAIFFITAADSASLVNSQMSQRGNPNPKKAITVFWVLMMAGIAIVILLMGGATALSGLQNLVTITALPFAIVLAVMAFSFLKEIRRDPLMLRHLFAESAIKQAVRQGIAEHGDNFEIAVDPVPADSDRAAGAKFDSTSKEFTEWYQRTDEDGNPIEYDYKTGAYVEDELENDSSRGAIEP